MSIKVFVFLCLMATGLLFAAETDNNLLEKRYSKWINQLRCPVCAGQNIAESNAQTAMAMRQTLWEMLQSQKTDHQIQDFFISRYGAQVITEPVVQNNTLALWLMPYLILLLLALRVFLPYFRSKKK